MLWPNISVTFKPQRRSLTITMKWVNYVRGSFSCVIYLYKGVVGDQDSVGGPIDIFHAGVVGNRGLGPSPWNSAWSKEHFDVSYGHIRGSLRFRMVARETSESLVSAVSEVGVWKHQHEVRLGQRIILDIICLYRSMIFNSFQESLQKVFKKSSKSLQKVLPRYFKAPSFGSKNPRVSIIYILQ